MYRCEFCHRLEMIDWSEHVTIDQKRTEIHALFDLADRVARLRRAYGRRHGRYRG